MTFFNFMRNAGYTDVERGERGSTEEHLTVTQFKVQAEQQRLEAVTGQVAQAEAEFGGCQSCHSKTEKETGIFAKGNQGGKDHCADSAGH